MWDSNLATFVMVRRTLHLNQNISWYFIVIQLTKCASLLKLLFTPRVIYGLLILKKWLKLFLGCVGVVVTETCLCVFLCYCMHVCCFLHCTGRGTARWKGWRDQQWAGRGWQRWRCLVSPLWTYSYTTCTNTGQKQRIEALREKTFMSIMISFNSGFCSGESTDIVLYQS